MKITVQNKNLNNRRKIGGLYVTWKWVKRIRIFVSSDYFFWYIPFTRTVRRFRNFLNSSYNIFQEFFNGA